jgi:hypothetical protein
MATASLLGLVIGWFTTYLYVYLVYIEGYDINIVSPIYIGIGAILSAIAFLYFDVSSHIIIAAFVKAFSISILVTGLLYYTTLLVA